MTLNKEKPKKIKALANLMALIIGFVGAIGGILANMIYQFLKKKLK